MKKVLIATTNKGKVEEMRQLLGDLPFDFVSLDELEKDIPEPEETGSTLMENAVLKAKYYAVHSGLMSISDDTGLFITAMEGWPGIHTARVFGGDPYTWSEQLLKVLEEKNVQDRTAEFRACIAIHEPTVGVTFTSEGSLEGSITTAPHVEEHKIWGYNSIFYVSELEKTYGEMSVTEKNAVSHRGKALIKAKRYMHNQYRGKHFVVPIGFVVKDGKLLMNRRNDPHNPKYHGIWEFPGGSVEMGETVEESMIKECKEETGFDVELVGQLSAPRVKSFEYDSGSCQFYIIPFLCKPVGGELDPSDEEVLEAQWYSYDEALELKKFPGDTETMEAIRPIYEQLVAEHNL